MTSPISRSREETVATRAMSSLPETSFDCGLEVLDDRVDRRLDAPLETHRVRAGGDVLQALADDRLSEHRRRRRAVAGDVVRRRRDLAHELRALVLEDVLDLDLASDRDAVIRDRGRAELLVEHDVAPLRAKGDLDRVGEDVHAALESAPGILVELQLFVSHAFFFLLGLTHFAPAGSRVPTTFASTSDSRRIRYSSVPTLISVPAVLGEDDLVALRQVHRDELSVVVPAARADGEDAAALRLLLRRIRKHDAAEGDCSSSSRTSTIRRSPSGFRFIQPAS